MESALGEGTTFSVILPRSAAPASPPTQDVLSIRTERAAKVLVVEDDEVLRRTTASALTRAGFTVVEATDGEHALTLGTDSTIDLVVTDVVMPRHNGPALVAQLRATRPGIPVLYVSGYVQDDDALDLEAPNTAFLGKPYTSAGLVNAVEALLESGSA